MAAKPPTIGRMLKLLLIDQEEGYGLSVTEAAQRLHVTRASLSRLLNDRCRLTPNMAARLARFSGIPVHVFINTQASMDAWEAEHLEVAAIEPMAV